MSENNKNEEIWRCGSFGGSDIKTTTANGHPFVNTGIQRNITCFFALEQMEDDFWPLLPGRHSLGDLALLPFSWLRGKLESGLKTISHDGSNPQCVHKFH